jgi:hypothetical protein
MAYLVLAALALWLILRASRRGLKRREWRLVTGAAAVAALAGAAYAGVREAWVPAAVLVMFGGWLALSTRQPPGSAPPPAQRPGRLSLAEARSILGVAPDATPAEIQAAYTRLMRSVHPDKGGTSGLAAQLNAARDRLLKG